MAQFPARRQSPYGEMVKTYIDETAATAAANSTAGSSTDAGVASQITNGAATQSALVTTDHKRTALFSVRDYGATGVASNNASPGIQAAVNAARDAGGGIVFLPPGEYRCETPIDLPDFTAWEDPWSIQRSIAVVGSSKWAVKMYLDPAALSTARYLIGHPSVGGTGAGNPRGQNSFQCVMNMTLLGPGYSLADGNAAMAYDVPVLAISNVYKGDFAELHIEGCPASPAILNWSDNQNGSQGNRFRGITTFKGHWEIVNGEKVFSIEEVRRRSMRYLLHNSGPVGSVGKANDNIVTDCHVYDPLIGVIDTRGHLTPGGTNDPAGGTDNLRILDNFFAARSIYEVEEGTLEDAGSATQVTLRVDADTYDPANDFVNCVLRVLNPTTGRWESAWIDAHDLTSRVVTVAGTGFSFVPTSTTEYHVQYSDAQARADGWSPEVRPHAVLWASRDYEMRLGDTRCEGMVSLVASAGLASEHGVVANYEVRLQFPHEVVNKNVYGMRTDGTPWRPKMWVSSKPRGLTSAPADAQFQSVAFSNPVAEDGARGPVTHMVNASATTVTNGAVMSIRSTARGEVTNSATTNVPHVVVWNAAPPPDGWRTGERLTIALPGAFVQIQVNTATAVAVGDLIIPTTGRVGVPVSPATATVEQLSRAVGVALATSTVGGVQLVWCKIR